MVIARSLFCDDIREEVGGKQSFMGVYAGRLIVREFPCILPTFSINTWMAFSKLAELDGVAIVLDIMGEQRRFDIDPDTLATLREEFETDTYDSPRNICPGTAELAANIVVSPLVIKEKGSITVDVVTSSGRYQAGCLNIVGEDDQGADRP